MLSFWAVELLEGIRRTGVASLEEACRWGWNLTAHARPRLSRLVDHAVALSYCSSAMRAARLPAVTVD